MNWWRCSSVPAPPEPRPCGPILGSGPRKLIDRLDAHDVKWSITVALQPAVRATIEAIPDAHWQDIDYTTGGQAQVAETTYVTGKGHRQRRVRLVVRRTRLAEPAQRQLWPDWRHHTFITNRDDLDTLEADHFHRQHAVTELAIGDLKEGTGAQHIPSGHYHANAAWLACAVLAHNLGHWATILAGQPPVTNRTRRTRLIALPAVLANRSGKPTLRFPARWPWTQHLDQMLNALRGLPAPSG